MASLKVKDISTLIKEALNMDQSKEEKTVLRAIDIAVRDMSEIRDWPKLRMKQAFTMAGADAALPADIVGVTGVKSSTEVYFKAEEEDTLSTDGRAHWYYASQQANDPTATMYFNIVDTAGAVASATVTAFYWAYHPKVSSDNDDILIPGPQAIAMLSIVILLGLNEHKTIEAEPFRQQYDKALAELMQRYPSTARAKLPRGRHGLPIAYGDLG